MTLQNSITSLDFDDIMPEWILVEHVSGWHSHSLLVSWILGVDYPGESTCIYEP